MIQREEYTNVFIVKLYILLSTMEVLTNTKKTRYVVDVSRVTLFHPRWMEIGEFIEK